MTLAKKLASMMNSVVEEFEKKTLISGLKFEFETVARRNRRTLYYYTAKVPGWALGILGNNFKDVQVVIRIYPHESEEMVVFDADFNYNHYDGGSNGVSVMNADGKERFGLMIMCPGSQYPGQELQKEMEDISDPGDEIIFDEDPEEEAQGNVIVFEQDKDSKK